MIYGCPRAQPPTDQKASAITRETWLRAHQALAHLENQQYSLAEEILADLAKQHTDNLFVWQNLSICREQQLQTKDPLREPEFFTTLMSKALAAIDRWQALAPKSPLPKLIAARVLLKSGERTPARERLRQAIQLDPSFLPAWYELYSSLGGGQGLSAEQWQDLPPPLQQEFLQVGWEIERAAPDNWFFLKDWIIELAIAGESRLGDTLTRLREQIGPFSSIVERDLRINPLIQIDQAILAVTNRQFDEAIRALRPVVNVLLRPEAPFDQALLQKHSLEFVLHDLTPTTPLEAITPPPLVIPISFEERPLASPPEFKPLRVMGLDFDVDTRPDILAFEGGTIHWAKIDTRQAPIWETLLQLDDVGGWNDWVAADLDDDATARPNDQETHPSTPRLADPDVILFGSSGILVLENRLTLEGKRQLIPHYDNQPWLESGPVHALTVVDVDHDGDLDIVAASNAGLKIYLQLGEFRFIDVTERSMLPPNDLPITALASVDWDRDIDLDILVSTPSGLRLLENLRHGRLRDHTLEKLPNGFRSLTQLTVADLDHNPAWDLVGSGPSGLEIMLFRRQHPAAHLPEAYHHIQLSDQLVVQHEILDVDNDGWVDIAALDRQLRLWRCSSRNTWSNLLNPLSHTTSRFAIYDLDQDGDLDILLNESLRWWENHGGNSNSWLDVRLVAQQSKGSQRSDSRRVNHQGIGSTLELRAGTAYQAAIVTNQSTHFGLGNQSTVDILRVLWTNGVPNTYANPNTNTTLYEEQLPIGSCPFLYSWNGNKYTFVTDLLWNAPLGLKTSEQTTAAWRSWEYLKISSSQLVPKDKYYDLRITEELWETAYIDKVALYAIDHPHGTQIYSNEKVGPTELANPGIYVVTNIHHPRMIKDCLGNNLLPPLSKLDGDYAVAYQFRMASGLVNEHYLEVEFEQLPQYKRLTLFLTGWLFPTDTSLNIQLSQHPSLPSPAPPSLWTPAPDGNWTKRLEFTGFPGGKTKTVAIDLTGLVPHDDPRIRIVTNMEFAWDEVFYTIDTPFVHLPIDDPLLIQELKKARLALNESTYHKTSDTDNPRELMIHRLQLGAAELVYRGFSEPTYSAIHAPENYDYHRILQYPRWPPVQGHFTRWGDVKNLVSSWDDRLVVMSPGDELRLKFEEIPAPPDGWRRDYIIFCVGWDKDAVLSTVLGHTSEPYPCYEMIYYGDTTRPLSLDAMRYEDYLRSYQTRTMDHMFWHRFKAIPSVK